VATTVTTIVTNVTTIVTIVITIVKIVTIDVTSSVTIVTGIRHGRRLVIELEVEVVFVELVHPHVSILTAASISLTVGSEHDGVDGAEVALHPPELLLEHHVEEPSLELAHPAAGGGDLHGVLAAAKDDVVEDGRHGGGVHWTLRHVPLHHGEVVGVEEHGAAILGGGEEGAPVLAGLHVRDGPRCRGR